MSKLSEMRAAHAAKVASATTSSDSGTSYPFWNIKTGETAVVRFLPDANEANPWGFFQEVYSLKLKFPGQIGGDYPTDEEVTVTLKTLENWDGKNGCPIKNDIAPLWKDESTKPLARLFYRNLSYHATGLIITSPLAETNVPENPIRRFVLNKSLHDVIMTTCMDPERESIPCDVESGYEFNIRKTQNGQYASYTTSSFNIRARPLTQTERDVVQKFGLVDLRTAIGERPCQEAIDMMLPMYRDSREGRPFDFGKYGKHYRAYGAYGAGKAAASEASGTAVKAEHVKTRTSEILNGIRRDKTAAA